MVLAHVMLCSGGALVTSVVPKGLNASPKGQLEVWPQREP